MTLSVERQQDYQSENYPENRQLGEILPHRDTLSL